MPDLPDARAGLDARAAFGPPPATVAGLVRWVEAHFPLIVRWCDTLPDGVNGVYKALDRPAPALAGIILLRPGQERPRWVLAHELGHALTGCRAGYFLWSDGRYHSNLAAERSANECAAALLLDIDGIRGRLAEDWRLSDIAAAEDVTPEAVRLRMSLAVRLGESRPDRLNALHAAMASGRVPRVEGGC